MFEDMCECKLYKTKEGEEYRCKKDTEDKNNSFFYQITNKYKKQSRKKIG